MIVAKSKTFPKGIAIDGLVNRGGWFGKTWLVLIGTGFDPFRCLVEAEHEGAAIDEIVDSKWGFHLTEDVEPCENCQKAMDIEQTNAEMGQETPYEAIRLLRDQCSCSFGGNFAERIDDMRISIIERCKVNYFAKRSDYPELR